MAASASLLCPAHRCKPGSLLLGVRQDDGTTVILPQPLPIDRHFIQTVKEHPVPAEERFRFTNKCIEGGCKQWTGTGCGVAERVVEFLETVPQQDALPACGIRDRCRWYVQRGGDGCKVCPFVLTEIAEEDVAAVWEYE